MAKSRLRKKYTAVHMEDGLTTSQRLQQWGAAAELLYAPHSPITQPPAPKEPYTFLVARRIATVMARLNTLCQAESGALLTPRDALLELADIIRFGLVSFHNEIVKGQLTRAETTSVLADYVAHRTTPQAGIVESLHVITWVSVKLRVEMFLAQLRIRLRAELEANQGVKRTSQQLTALRTTLTFLSDFESFYDNILVTFPCVQLMDTTPKAAEQLMPILSRQYYQLADWVSLVEANASQTLITETRVQSIDRETSTVVLHRTDLTSPWGLMFNQCGQIVDVDTALRVATTEGEEFHRLLCCTAEGATVVAVNSTTLPNGLSESSAGVLELFRETTKSNKRIVIQLEADALKQSWVQQLAFLVPNQGGEGSSGQRASLVLHRPDKQIMWGFDFTNELIVKSVPKRRLSIEAKSFFADYRGRVGLMAVNGVEVTTSMQAEALCANTETVVLNFVVVTPIMARRSRNPSSNNIELALSQQQIEEISETSLVNQTNAMYTRERKKTHKDPQPQLKQRENAEDLDAAADVAYTAHANEAEELTAEPVYPAEEDDVKETYPMVADEEVVSDGELTVDGESQKPTEKAVAASTRTTTMTVLEPLLLPNNVTIELLTPTEMLIRRDSIEGRWGLKLESSNNGIEKKVRLVSLADLTSKNDARRRHPFFKTFHNPPVETEWRIQSVNKMLVSEGEKLFDMMRRSLKMHIKFFKGR